MPAKKIRIPLLITLLMIISLACGLTGQTGSSETDIQETEVSMRLTEVALAEIRLTTESQALEQTTAAQAQAQIETQSAQGTANALAATDTPGAVMLPTISIGSGGQAQPTVQQPAAATQTVEPASDKIIQAVTTDKDEFYCIAASGAAKLKVTAKISDISKGMTIFWRLQEKNSGKTTEWEQFNFQRETSTTRAITFDADVTAGTNNFYYPPGYGESWFQFQIIENSNIERTEVFSHVTFYPCAN